MAFQRCARGGFRLTSLLCRWYLIVFEVLVMTLFIVGYQTYQSSDSAATDADWIKRRYPVEAVIMELFPIEAREMMDQLKTIRKLPAYVDKFTYQWQLRNAWKLNPSTPPKGPMQPKPKTTKQMGPCQHQPLPLHILQQVVAESLSLQDHLPYHHALEEPLLILPSDMSSSTLCIRAVIPRLPESNTVPDERFRYLYQPFAPQHRLIASPWWDSLMVSFNHLDTGASLPIAMEPWYGHEFLRKKWREMHADLNYPQWSQDLDLLMIERSTMHIYEGVVHLHDPGTYRVEGRLEYQGAQWNFEKGPVVAYQPKMMSVNHPTLKIVVNNYEGAVEEHLKQPLCTKADHPGRWLPAGTLDRPDIIGKDRHGKFWAPFDCRYRFIDYPEFHQCIAKRYPKGIDMFGDSNIRRSLKNFITQGAWCRDWDHATKQQSGDPRPLSLNPLNWSYTNQPDQRRVCYCEDYGENNWNKTWFDPTSRNNTLTLGTASGHQFKVRNFKWDGLTPLNHPPWPTFFAQVQSPANVSIFSIGNWDAAFMTLDDFNTELDKLVQLIRQYYPDQRIIYRTPQYFCCRVDYSDRKRRTSEARLRLFDQLARDAFVRKLRAVVWDTYALGEARTWDEKLETTQCPSNHVSADVVNIENQILMNLLCNDH